MGDLEKLVKEFRARIEEARQNPLLIDLDAYESMIAGNIEDGNLNAGRYHADLLAEFYVDENPFRPTELPKMEAAKENNPELYRAMDAAKKAYSVGLVAKQIAKTIDEQGGRQIKCHTED